MPKGFSLFIVPETNIVTREGFMLTKGVAYGVTGGTQTTEVVAYNKKHEVTVHRQLSPYKCLTRDEALALGLKLPSKKL